MGPAYHCLQKSGPGTSRLGDVGPADRQLIAGTWGRCAAVCDDVPPSYRVASRFSTPFQIQTTIVVFFRGSSNLHTTVVKFAGPSIEGPSVRVHKCGRESMQASPLPLFWGPDGTRHRDAPMNSPQLTPMPMSPRTAPMSPQAAPGSPAPFIQIRPLDSIGLGGADLPNCFMG